jgi:hypothetical protein
MVFCYPGYWMCMNGIIRWGWTVTLCFHMFLISSGSSICANAIIAFHFRGHQVVLGTHPAWTLTKASGLFVPSSCNDSSLFDIKLDFLGLYVYKLQNVSPSIYIVRSVTKLYLNLFFLLVCKMQPILLNQRNNWLVSMIWLLSWHTREEVLTLATMLAGLSKTMVRPTSLCSFARINCLTFL